MSNDLSASERSKMFNIMGLPEHGKSIVTTALVHWPYTNVQVWQPTFSTGDMSSLVAAINTNIGLVAQTQIDIYRGQMITEWDDTFVSEIDLQKSAAGDAGNVVVCAEARREVLRQALGNMIGVSVPKGGFMAEVRATYGDSLGKIVSGEGGR